MEETDDSQRTFDCKYVVPNKPPGWLPCFFDYLSVRRKRNYEEMKEYVENYWDNFRDCGKERKPRQPRSEAAADAPSAAAGPPPSSAASPPAPSSTEEVGKFYRKVRSAVTALEVEPAVKEKIIECVDRSFSTL